MHHVSTIASDHVKDLMVFTGLVVAVTAVTGITRFGSTGGP
jgi:hypothetical protein